MQAEYLHLSESKLSCETLILCVHAKTVTVAGESVAVTPLEFNLLAYLVRNQTRPVSVEELLEAVWHCADGGTVNQVTCCIKRLRKKLTVDGVPQYLHTQRGFGFRLCEPGKLPSPTERGIKNS